MTSDAVRLLLVRHGRCVDTEAGLIPRSGSALSSVGRLDVRRLARTWSDQPPDRIFAGTLRRAGESASELAQPWDVACEADHRLNEASFGAWEGWSWDDVACRMPREWRRWSRSWQTAPPPGGESLPVLLQRVGAWLDSTLLAATPGATFVAVTHGGVIRCALIHLLGITAAAAFRFSTSHASVSAMHVSCAPGGRLSQISFVNSPTFR